MRISRDVSNELITTRRGYRESTSVSGTLTGLGGNIFIIDDPQKPIDAQSETLRNGLNGWYANTLVSRLDNKETGVIIIIMQRVHADDLSGFLAGSSDEWTVLGLPAIAEVPERIQIGPDRFYERSIGEALHPAYVIYNPDIHGSITSFPGHDSSWSSSQGMRWLASVKARVSWLFP
jgi:hypothetical protein